MNRTEMHAKLDELLDQGGGSYEGSANAARDALVLVFNHAADELGLTGFQGSWAALQGYWTVMGHKGGGLVLKDEDLRYPQYDHHATLDRHLNDPTLIRWLGDEGEALLANENRFAATSVIEHWQRLVAARDALPAEQLA